MTLVTCSCGCLCLPPVAQCRKGHIFCRSHFFATFIFYIFCRSHFFCQKNCLRDDFSFTFNSFLHLKQIPFPIFLPKNCLRDDFSFTFISTSSTNPISLFLQKKIVSEITFQSHLFLHLQQIPFLFFLQKKSFQDDFSVTFLSTSSANAISLFSKKFPI